MKKLSVAEKEYFDSLIEKSEFPYNLNDVKLYSGNDLTSSAYHNNLGHIHIMELWDNTAPSSDIDETKKRMEEFERPVIDNLLEQIEMKKVLVTPINYKEYYKEYYKFLEILVDSGIISEKELTTNPKTLIKFKDDNCNS